MKSSGARRKAKVLFITGTDTGVGKTLLTALLVKLLRDGGVRAVGLKPFCSGSRADVEFLQAVQPGIVEDNEVNPYYYPLALAPGVAARVVRGKGISRPTLKESVRFVESVAKRFEVALIEGAGGVYVPCGEGFMVMDLIIKLGVPVVVVGRNALGTINHTVLTVKALQHVGVKEVTVVLMGAEKPDLSAKTNIRVIRGLIAPVEVISLPFFGSQLVGVEEVATSCKKIEKTLARLVEITKLTPLAQRATRVRLSNKNLVDSRCSAD